MQLQWWWNSDFEGLMHTVRGWLKEHASIQIVKMDWKYEAGAGAWYMVLVYKGPAL